MHKAAIAEQIFSFFIIEDQAVTKSRDLVERTSNHGALRFWASVFQICAASVAHSFVTRPWRTLGMAILSFLIEVLAPLPFMFFSVRFLFFWSAEHHVLWLSVLFSLCTVTFTQYLAGCLLVRLAPENPGNICVAVGILNFVAGALSYNMASVNMAIWQVPVIVGVIMSQGRYNRPSSFLVLPRAV